MIYCWEHILETIPVSEDIIDFTQLYYHFPNYLDYSTHPTYNFIT